MEIERRTGCKIKELFDWLVGTSVGGVICLSIVYSKYNSHHLHACFHTVTIDLAENTLEETRQMLMRLRNVFSSGSMVIGAKRRTKNMNKLLQAEGRDTRMNSKTDLQGFNICTPDRLICLCIAS